MFNEFKKFRVDTETADEVAVDEVEVAVSAATSL